MSELSANLVALATACGVATEYWDWRGEYVDVPESTVIAVLDALGVDASTPSRAGAELARLDAERWHRMLPACVVRRIDDSRPTTFWVHVPHGDPAVVHLELEDGTRREAVQLDRWVDPNELDGSLIGEATFELPTDLPLGWHTLRASSHDRHAETTLVVVPPRVANPLLDAPAELRHRQTWGWLTQLYQVRSRTSWGFGDLSDLAELISWSGKELGAGFVLVNPLHAAAPVPPIEPSPYLPMTRRFVNPLYLSIESIPECAQLSTTERARVAELARPLQARGGPDDLIDRDAVWVAKKEALELIHAAGRSPARQSALGTFLAREGVGLLDFATWCALVEEHGPEWMTWPEELRNPATPEVALERERLAKRVEFHAWLQWLIDEQLADVAASAADAGMPLGVIHDLAVGVHPGGADSWALQDVLAIGASVGAPPDAFTQHGQDWSQPPWKPRQLAERGYAPYRDMIRAALRHGGGLRVDHVMGLFRLWWVPTGCTPSEGTYVRYDHEAMVGILALEAHRAGALVIGEDLGTVEPWVREYLHERGMLGTSILWFERDANGPLRPEQWRELCLGTVTTHDLPPTRGYLTGEHVALRNRLGLLKNPVEQEWAALHQELAEWRALLDELGIDRGGEVGDAGAMEATVAALHRFLAQTRCLLLGVTLADAVGDRRTHNQPGTYQEYPNWQHGLVDPDGRPVFLEDIKSAESVARLIGLFRDARADTHA
jgi:4-alpha-glucanotransferase